MKRLILVAAVVVVGLAYVAGYWPQNQRLTGVRAELEATERRLSASDARIRLAEVLGRLLVLSDAVAAKNYGQAATLSSSFFDAVRIEASRTDQPEVTTTLEDVLKVRDQVTTAIAGMDPSLSAVLKEQERSLRRALGFPVGDVP